MSSSTTPASDLPPRNPACDLPDLPRWVEARAAVLSGDCDIFGMPGEDACVIRCTRLPLATVVGKPSTELLLRALDIAGDKIELLVMPEDAEHVARVLRYWRQVPVTLHTRPDAAPAAHAPTGRSVRIYDPFPPKTLRNWPQQLMDEVKAARVVAAKRVDGTVVSICHTDAITETWWDVGVDTLETHRRQGHARDCFAALDRYLAQRGKKPVWGALDSNTASMTFARALGFEPVDKLVVFLPPRNDKPAGGSKG